MRRMSDETLVRLRKAKAVLKKRLQGHPDVIAVGIGYRERRGNIVQRGCIRIHVRKKFALDALPPELRLPTTIRGVPINVVESSFVAHTTNPANRCDPLLGGIVVTGERSFAATGKVGTVGCVVSPLGAPLLLSCWHVLYGPTGKDGDTVVQPRPAGTLNNIGKNLVGIFNDRVDCAVAELDISRGTSPTILGIPQAVLTTTSARPGLLVRKSGANGLGLGVIIGTESDPVVAVGGAPRTFIDQIEIVPRPGHQTQFKTGEMDSGALWVSDDDGRIIGLHFAGSPGRALANPIAAVVEALADRGISLGF